MNTHKATEAHKSVQNGPDEPCSQNNLKPENPPVSLFFLLL